MSSAQISAYALCAASTAAGIIYWFLQRTARRRLAEVSELRHRLMYPQVSDAMLGQLDELAAGTAAAGATARMRGRMLADWLRKSGLPSDLALAIVLVRIYHHAEILDEASDDCCEAWAKFRVDLAIAAADLSAIERDLAPRS